MIEKMKDELRSIEEGIYYMEQTDTAWSPAYTKLCKKRRILKRTIRRLEKLEVHKDERA
jgi:Mg2+ and Co2+ transporter CorA